jgi:hypothetical protein
MIKSAKNPAAVAPDPHYGYGIIRPDAALTLSIPAGPASGPLPQMSATAGASPQSEATSATPVAAARDNGSSAIGLIAGVVGALVVVLAAVVAFAARGRRRRATPPVEHMTQPPHDFHPEQQVPPPAGHGQCTRPPQGPSR